MIKSAKLGNPHGLLKVNAKKDGKDEEWTVEVGQPWRNERAGLKDSMLVKGVELTIQGNRAKDPKLKVVKAARVIINGKIYDLYPERSSSGAPMLAEWLTALQELPFVAELRNSRWTYAAVNASHIVGIALLFGAIVPLDLRLMGCWRSVPIRTLARILVPVAACGLVLAIAAGLLLFSIRATAIRRH